MRAEARIQLALAAVGVPAILLFWKGDAKWPNPFLQPPSKPGGTAHA